MVLFELNMRYLGTGFWISPLSQEEQMTDSGILALKQRWKPVGMAMSKGDQLLVPRAY